MKICPKCTCEFEDMIEICSDCGTPLIDKPAEPEKGSIIDWLFSFGKASSKDLLKVLYYTGIFPIFISACMLSGYISAVSSNFGSNIVLCIILIPIFFVVEIITWKVFCELLHKIFRCLEVYTEKNKK